MGRALVIDLSWPGLKLRWLIVDVAEKTHRAKYDSSFASGDQLSCIFDG